MMYASILVGGFWLYVILFWCCGCGWWGG